MDEKSLQALFVEIGYPGTQIVPIEPDYMAVFFNEFVTTVKIVGRQLGINISKKLEQVPDYEKLNQINKVTALGKHILQKEHKGREVRYNYNVVLSIPDNRELLKASVKDAIFIAETAYTELNRETKECSAAEQIKSYYAKRLSNGSELKKIT